MLLKALNPKMQGPGDYSWASRSSDDWGMRSTRGLRHPITISIKGKPVKLVTVGHLAAALRRTNWTIDNWIRIGLLPEPPFLLRPEVPRMRRRLYPEAFVTLLSDIADRDYYGPRLDRANWLRFNEEVAKAYQRAVEPLFDPGVTDQVPSTAVEDEVGRLKADQHNASPVT